ncbi:hypothetical protein AB0D38_19355 [Streptomyces sp. NPDC048279]|uniref:hypothetical protein n=1 Tax=Streptomyces sp. NPDC048279 TaxID=3154714 RepID=UPI00343A1DB9
MTNSDMTSTAVSQVSSQTDQPVSRTTDTAEITPVPEAYGGGCLAVCHTALADGRFHTAVATSTDLRTWTRRHDFGPGTSQPSLYADGTAGRVLAYERDPANHIAPRHYPSLAALPAGAADHAFDAARTLSRRAEGTPDITAVHGDSVEPTGHYRAGCDIDRQLHATLRDFTVWRARADQRLDLALVAWGTAGNIGDRSRIELLGRPLVLAEGRRLRDDFGSRPVYAYDPVQGPGRPAPAAHPRRQRLLRQSVGHAAHRPRRPSGPPGQRLHPEGGVRARRVRRARPLARTVRVALTRRDRDVTPA